MKNNHVLLFLDFDGVTHPAHDYVGFFRIECMVWLDKIIRENSELQVVISSSWRKHYPIDELKTMLGPTVAPRVIGVTPVINTPLLRAARYHEVIAHLEKTNNNNANWLALDDVKEFYTGHEGKVIFTNPMFGITQKEYEEINFLLKGKNISASASSTKKIINNLFQIPKGESFTNKEFLKYGSRTLVNKVLARMNYIRLIHRVMRGVYVRR